MLMGSYAPWPMAWEGEFATQGELGPYKVNHSEATMRSSKRGMAALALGTTVYAKQPSIDSVESRSSCQSHGLNSENGGAHHLVKVKAPCPPSLASLPPQFRQKRLRPDARTSMSNPELQLLREMLEIPSSKSWRKPGAPV